MFPPSRIVCLTEETVETLYLLGQQDLIVGISGYVVRPPQARREKPRVSAFTSANTDKILGLKPDLVLTFSDLQTDIAADLIRRGLDVHAFNQRTVAGILDMIRMLGAMVGAGERAEQLVSDLEAALDTACKRAERLSKRPRVFFEEWDDPLISGIGWVSELVEIAGGIDIFATRLGAVISEAMATARCHCCPAARDRRRRLGVPDPDHSAMLLPRRSGHAVARHGTEAAVS